MSLNESTVEAAALEWFKDRFFRFFSGYGCGIGDRLGR
jgi:hypothetical protein